MGTVKKLMGDVVYGLHSAIGITAPPPEKRAGWFLVWLGLVAFFLVFVAALFYLFFAAIVGAQR